MHLHTFLNNERITQDEQRHKRYFFSGSKCPHLFFERFLHRISLISPVHIIRPDFERVTVEQILLDLKTSFLGQACWYWLGDLSVLSEKDQVKVLSYLIAYNGIHNIICYIPQHIFTTRKLTIPGIITIPDACDEALALSVYSFLVQDDKGFPASKALIQKLLSHSNTCSVDHIPILLNYADIVSRSMHDEFIYQWADRIMGREKSLFTLSGHFFNGQANHFFNLWDVLKLDFPCMFWLSFWSEQLCRATLFQYYMDQADIKSAAKVSFRLPFSFTKQGWKRFAYKQLAQLHDELYMLEYQIKNGLPEERLDTFFIRYFSLY